MNREVYPTLQWQTNLEEMKDLEKLPKGTFQSITSDLGKIHQ